jgi:hypothetical protein
MIRMMVLKIDFFDYKCGNWRELRGDFLIDTVIMWKI